MRTASRMSDTHYELFKSDASHRPMWKRCVSVLGNCIMNADRIDRFGNRSPCLQMQRMWLNVLLYRTVLAGIQTAD